MTEHSRKSKPPKRKRHAHCWHTLSSTTNGMGVAGYDFVHCCLCDARGRRGWVLAQDPNHGPYGEHTVFEYDEVRKVKR